MKHPNVTTARIKPGAPGAPRGKGGPGKWPVFATLNPPRPAAWPSDRPANLAAFFRHAEERVLGQVIAAAHAPDAEAIHDLRVTLRRFAELLQTARIAGLLPDGKGRRLLRRIRDIRRLGGDVRDIDVLLELLSRRPGVRHSPKQPGEAASGRRCLKLFQKRKGLVKKLQTELRKLIAGGFLAMLNRRLTATGRTALPTPTTGHIRRRVMVNRRNFVGACKVAAAKGNDRLIHRARIAAKKLRYSYELASEAGVADLQPILRRLKKFQKITGDLHDAHLAMEFFASDEKKTVDIPAGGVSSRIVTRHACLHAAAIKELADWLHVRAHSTGGRPKGRGGSNLLSRNKRRTGQLRGG